jgi:hypothetical protein
MITTSNEITTHETTRTTLSTPEIHKAPRTPSRHCTIAFPFRLPLTPLFARSIRFAYTLYPRAFPNAREHEILHGDDATITSPVEDTLFCQPCLQTCSFVLGPIVYC